jgi:heat shock protein HslJ|nr:META domain-containing protein [Sphingomonas sp.]
MITAFNGKPPQKIDSQSRSASISFLGATYSANSGCNALSGVGALRGTRFYTMSGPQTQIGCMGELLKQEALLEALLRAAPEIVMNDRGEMTMTGAGHEIRLKNDPGAATAAASPVSAPNLAGARFEIQSVDGTLVGAPGSSVRPSLSFTPTDWRARSVCTTVTGTWKLQGATMLTSNVALAKRGCESSTETIDQALREVFVSNPTLATGPNGEIVLAGEGRWISAIRIDDKRES